MMIRLEKAIRVKGHNAKVVSIEDGEDDSITVKVLYSYEMPVAVADDTGLYRTETAWSNTTQRHINTWLVDCPATVVSQDDLEARIERALQRAYHTGGRKAR